MADASIFDVRRSKVVLKSMSTVSWRPFDFFQVHVTVK